MIREGLMVIHGQQWYFKYYFELTVTQQQLRMVLILIKIDSDSIFIQNKSVIPVPIKDIYI